MRKGFVDFNDCYLDPLRINPAGILVFSDGKQRIALYTSLAASYLNLDASQIFHRESRPFL